MATGGPRVIRLGVILAAVAAAVVGVLVALNPRLLGVFALGGGLGIAVRGLQSTRPWRTRPSSGPNRRVLAHRRIWLLSSGLLVLVFGAISLFTTGRGEFRGERPIATTKSSVADLFPTPDDAVVHVPYQLAVKADPDTATWTITERYVFTGQAQSEVLRLLGRAGSPIAKDAAPEDVAATIAQRVTGAATSRATKIQWSWSLDTGQPVLLESHEDPIPNGGPWMYSAQLAISALRGPSFTVLPSEGSTATLEVPRHLVLEADPQFASEEQVAAATGERIGIDLPADSEELNLHIAPGWARNDVTGAAMSLSLGSAAALVVGGVSAAIAAAFGTVVLSRIRTTWQRIGRTLNVGETGKPVASAVVRDRAEPDVHHDPEAPHSE
jgi:hypothetical protein